jgi:iron complex outermembrane receptor protein
MNRFHRNPALCALLAGLAASVASHAQTASPSTAPQTVLVTGNPFARDALARPAQLLSGAALQQRVSPTLGQTLDGLPGVASTWFGPNASRPVLRGLDGERIRVLENSGSSVDASALSFDHATAADPLLVERVEVLRGPAALAFGGSAVGGVVNLIDNRIPMAAMEGLGGRAALRWGSASNERSAAAVLEGGSGARGLSWHVDAFGRRNGLLRVPLFTPVEDGVPLDPTKRARNSAAQASGASVGGSWFQPGQRLGASLETFSNDYGLASEEGAQIHMQRQRLRLDGEIRLASSAINGLAFQASHTRYRHDELEADGEVGTRFNNRHSELSASARQAGWLGWQGVWGVQWETQAFSALGEEAFVPGTDTRKTALWTTQERALGPGMLSVGARLERVTVASAGDAADATELRFGNAQTRRFLARSAALSWGHAPAQGLGWQLGFSHTERAPSDAELYANGLHLATGAYEVGDPGLGLERSGHLEAGLASRGPGWQWRIHLFQTRFANYIALDASGAQRPTDEGDVPEFVFRGVPARLRGAEAEASWALGRWASWDWGLQGMADVVRGSNLASGQALPRLAPWRFGLGLSARRGPWQADLAVAHRAAQRHVPVTDTSTAGHTLWNAGIAYSPAASRWLAWLRAENLGNRLAYNASTVQTLRDLVPLPGRAVRVGVQYAM